MRLSMCRWVLLLTTALAGCVYDVSGHTFAHEDSDAAESAPDAAEPPEAPPPDAMVDAAPPDATPAPPPLACPDDYQVDPQTGSAYRLGWLLKRWRAAERDCEDDGPGIHLAIVDDEAELASVSALAGVLPAWVGVSDRVDEDRFLGVDGRAPDFMPWDTGEPNDSGFGEDCVELRRSSFNDLPCAVPQRYVCECDGVAADDASY
jgi:Lectin C-type domain